MHCVHMLCCSSKKIQKAKQFKMNNAISTDDFVFVDESPKNENGDENDVELTPKNDATTSTTAVPTAHASTDTLKPSTTTAETITLPFPITEELQAMRALIQSLATAQARQSELILKKLDEFHERQSTLEAQVKHLVQTAATNLQEGIVIRAVSHDDPNTDGGIVATKDLLSLPASSAVTAAAAVRVDTRGWTAHQWSSLATSLPSDCAAAVGLGGERLSREQCYLRALECDSHFTLAWNNLGLCLADGTFTKVGGRRYTKQQCYQRALEQNPRFAFAWNNLAMTLGDPRSTIILNGETYDQQACYIKSIECDPTLGYSWNNVGMRIPPGQSLVIAGEVMTSLDCFRRAAETAPNLPHGWLNLARGMRDGTVSVGGKMYSRIELFVQCVIADPAYAIGWANLGAEMVEPTVDISGRPYTKVEVHTRSLELDPKSLSSLTNLAILMSPTLSVTVGGDTMTRKDLLVRALEIDFGYSYAWNALAATLGGHEMASINGELFSKADCSARVYAALTS